MSSTLVVVTENGNNLSVDDLATIANTIISILNLSSDNLSPQVRLLPKLLVVCAYNIIIIMQVLSDYGKIIDNLLTVDEELISQAQATDGFITKYGMHITENKNV